MIYKVGPDHAVVRQEMDLTEIDCAENKSRIIGIRIYDKDGKVFSSDEYETAAWNYAAPGTVGEALIKEVCRILNEGQFKEL